MKKEKKNGLLKGIGIILLIAILLTWIVPGSQFGTDGQLVKGDFVRIGVFDLSVYSFYGFQYFGYVFGYLFVLAGFYKFLNSLKSFKKLTSNIAKKVENYPFVFTVVSMAFYAILTSVIKDVLVMFLFVPFTIAIMSKLKQSKIATFTSSVGGILLGTLASTANGEVNILKTVFTVEKYNPEMFSTIGILIIGGVLLGILTLISNKKKDEEKVENLLEDEAVKIDFKKVSTLPLIIIGVLTSLFAIFGFIDWSNSFGVSVFADFATKVTESKIAGVPVFKYLIGQSSIAFGEWSIYTLIGLIVIATLILAIVYRVKLSKVVELYLEGFKAYAKPIFIVFVIYILFFTSAMFPTLGVVYNWIIDVFGSNSFTWTIISMISGLFGVAYDYTIYPISQLLIGGAGESQNVVAFATQLGYGLIQFVAPTGITLALGLTLLDINYKKYLKFIWKFFAAMTVISILVLIILAHVA